jgi:dinuclear metal center YbgI/SA1388 family protein
MLCKDIIKVIEHTYPKHVALEWDNVGLLAGRMEKDVQKIYIAVDATDEIIDDAIAKGAHMLITHHPLIFEPLKQINDTQFISCRILKLLQHDIAYYAMHTNYDVLGMAELAANIMGLTDTEVFEVTGQEPEQGIGRVGSLDKEMTLLDCCHLVKEKFNLKNVKVFGNLNTMVKRVAISPGSGKHMSGLAVQKKADVLVTGDIDHHEGIDAVAQGVAIIDAGHYGIEHIFVADIATYLENQLDNVSILTEIIKEPFQIIS